MRFKKRYAMMVLFWLVPAFGASPVSGSYKQRITGLTVSPNPVTIGQGLVRVSIEVKTTRPYSLLKPIPDCEVDVVTSSGQTLPHVRVPGGIGYSADLSSAVSVVIPAREGEIELRTYAVNGSCSGEASTKLKIVNAAATPQAAAPKPVCPTGWSLLEGSVSGAKYQCKVRPPSKLQCKDGTSYFEEPGLIGCR